MVCLPPEQVNQELRRAVPFVLVHANERIASLRKRTHATKRSALHCTAGDGRRDEIETFVADPAA